MLQRVVTGVLAAAIALAAILWREPWLLVALCGLALAFGAVEGAGITNGPIGLVAVGAFWLGFLVLPYELFVPDLVLVPWGIAALTLFVRFPNQYVAAFGVGNWIAAGLISALALSLQRPSGGAAFGPSLLLMAVVPLWVGDSLGYFVGRAVGRHKLAPSISPNKTWEGAAANFTGCMGTAIGLGAWLEVPVTASVAVGLSTGILGQIGDLLQSRLKRLVEVKDSGAVLPGHGGVLDRLDSFLFSSYPSLLCLHYLAPDAFHVKQWPW